MLGVIASSDLIFMATCCVLRWYCVISVTRACVCVYICVFMGVVCVSPLISKAELRTTVFLDLFLLCVSISHCHCEKGREERDKRNSWNL